MAGEQPPETPLPKEPMPKGPPSWTQADGARTFGVWPPENTSIDPKSGLPPPPPVSYLMTRNPYTGRNDIPIPVNQAPVGQPRSNSANAPPPPPMPISGASAPVAKSDAPFLGPPPEAQHLMRRPFFMQIQAPKWSSGPRKSLPPRPSPHHQECLLL